MLPVRSFGGPCTYGKDTHWRSFLLSRLSVSLLEEVEELSTCRACQKQDSRSGNNDDCAVAQHDAVDALYFVKAAARESNMCEAVSRCGNCFDAVSKRSVSSLLGCCVAVRARDK